MTIHPTIYQALLPCAVVLSLIIAAVSPPASCWIAVFYLGQAAGMAMFLAIETSYLIIERIVKIIFRDKILIEME